MPWHHSKTYLHCLQMLRILRSWDSRRLANYCHFLSKLEPLWLGAQIDGNSCALLWLWMSSNLYTKCMPSVISKHSPFPPPVYFCCQCVWYASHINVSIEESTCWATFLTLACSVQGWDYCFVNESASCRNAVQICNIKTDTFQNLKCTTHINH